MSTAKETAPLTPRTLPLDFHKNQQHRSAGMRKYQQLTLAIVSVISLIAFLFYKHEYDRLRYTLEYLDMFGKPSTNLGSSVVCDNHFRSRSRTATHFWTVLSEGLAIYSVFWEESFGLTKSKIRILALTKNIHDNISLNVKVFHDSNLRSSSAVCFSEDVPSFNYKQTTSLFTYIICEPSEKYATAPSVIQFQLNENKWTTPIAVQESESWKSVPDVSCLCVFSSNVSISTVHLVEFISHHSNIGFEKFVFYGPIVTSVARKLLDKHADEVNIFYEELPYNIPDDIPVDSVVTRSILQSDCQYRHRNVYENVMVLNVNEFFVPKTGDTVKEILKLIDYRETSAISEYQFLSKQVCVDEQHSVKQNLLLDSHIQTSNPSRNTNISLIRPHLQDGGKVLKNFKSMKLRRVPESVATVYVFGECEKGAHLEVDHLPKYERYANAVKSSHIYRKWSVI